MSYDRDREPDIDVDELRKQTDHGDLLADLEYMSGDEYGSGAFLTDDTIVGKKKKKKSKKEEETQAPNGGDWFSSFMDDIHAAEVGATRKPRRGQDIEDILGNGGKKKKKKKKKKDGEPTDFKKEFETENLLYTNLLRDQTKFVSSLQASYDTLSGRKASGRGMTKNEQDLIANITSARSLCAQLVDKRANLKKLATELSMKERKELGIGSADGTGLGEFGSAYLKKLIDERHMLEQGGSDTIYDMDEAEVADALQDRLEAPIPDKDKDLYSDTDRTSESETYLKYENANIKTYVSINSQDETDWYYVARDPEGNEIDDYPLPVSDIGSINRSTNIMTDEFGQKYTIEWR